MSKVIIGVFCLHENVSNEDYLSYLRLSIIIKQTSTFHRNLLGLIYRRSFCERIFLYKKNQQDSDANRINRTELMLRDWNVCEIDFDKKALASSSSSAMGRVKSFFES